MYHLNDPPIRTQLDWSDFDTMISDISQHFETDVANVVDAYEVLTPLPDIPLTAVPIIVHLLPDLPLGQSAKLVLVDIEFHPHPCETTFQIGPDIQRFVAPTPEWCDRQMLLTLTNVDRYRALERDRCFVWHGTSSWLDTDVRKRQLSNGDYLRIALPPSERVACPTVEIVERVQYSPNSLDSGCSPSPLSETKVRSLAASNIHHQLDSDVFHAMQFSCTMRDQTTEAQPDELQQLTPNASSVDSLPPDWLIDLERLVQAFARQQADASHDTFTCSVFTWYLDAETNTVCTHPKLVVLGAESDEWEHELKYAWRYRI